ncbi:MAG TPA: glycosyltransferase [Pyrinomonadaceae bacterium]
MKPKVLHIIDSFEQGGTERQAVQLVRLLQAEGRYEVRLACLNKRGVLLDEAERFGIGEIVEYPMTSFYDRNFVRQQARAVRFLKEQEIKVVHTHDFYTNIFGMIAARLARVPARIASKRETEGFRTPAQKRVERYAYQLAHSVITNADAVRKQLIGEGVRAEKLVTVYNGLDLKRVAPPTDLLREEALAMLGLPPGPERRYVTIVANIQHAVKDHPTFLRAAQRVRAAVPEAAFIIAGEGALLSDLRALAAELGIERDTFFIGRCQRIAELLSISNVCVLSSRAEGFSNSILEYMAAARAVVATDVGGAREAIREGETGYLVAAGDDDSMAARIISLLNDPARARAMGERGRRIVEEKFSCEAQLASVESLYERLLVRPDSRLGQRVESVTSERA